MALLTTPTEGALRLAEAPVSHVVDQVWLVRWLLRLRWAAVALSALGVALSSAWGRTSPGAAGPLWGGVIGLALFNAILWRRPPETLASSRGLVAQILVDGGLLAWLVHHAGGLTNPFSPFFVFHATTAGVLLPPRQALWTSASLAGIVAGLSLAEATEWTPPWPLLDAAGLPLTLAPATNDAVLLASGLALAGTVFAAGRIVSSLVGALRRERVQVTAERENLQRIIDCMADAVLFVTPDGQIRLRNAVAAQLWPPDAGPAPDLRQCHPPERWQALVDLLRRKEPLTVHPVLEVRGRHFEASWAHVFAPDGDHRGVVMVARDITERVERQRAQMREERMATVGKLAAGLAHELNNPLGAIALFSQHALTRLQRTPEDPLVDHLGTVLRNANLCKGIVRDLLDYARQRPPSRTDVDVAELLGDAERTLAPRAQTSNARLVVETASDTPRTLYGDADQLRQVLVNLGLNALEAMEARAGTVSLQAAPGADGGVRLCVVDDGPGVPATAREAIFQAFHTSKSEGTGLGLTVAQDIVAAHGGRLVVEDGPSGGARFTFEIGPRGGLLRGGAT